MDEEYSVAVFEDGTKEMIPKAWIQDYLKDEVSNGETCNNNIDNSIDIEQHVHTTIDLQKVDDNVLLFDSLHNESTKIILENLIKEVAENKSIILQLQRSVDRLICIATGEPEPTVHFEQPAKSLGDFLAIEEYIRTKHNYDEMVTNLGKIGGRTVESATRKIWSRLCTTQLATTICWTGANGKYCLKAMAVNNLVRDAVLVTHPLGKECDIHRATMLWFSHAQDRLRTKKYE